MSVPYLNAGLCLEGSSNDPVLVRALQRDLRALGYLRAGIDGAFGSGTERAVRALQYDLLHNDGRSSGGDGAAPTAMTAFNTDGRGGKAITAVTGVVDEPFARCVDAILADARVPQLPSAVDPAAANRAALAAILYTNAPEAPAPFIAAIVMQESGGRHYNEPGAADDDKFVMVGLDRNNRNDADQITSRGYGIGQYTLFHHPPRAEEISELIVDPVKNVAKTFAELRDKFDHFVIGPADSADDRRVEQGEQALRRCRYPATDPRFMRDCRACVAAAPKIGITQGQAVYAGATITYQPSQYYPSANYRGVPNRAALGCDWPYAARRYNGGGVNSYHYQARVLLNLANLPAGKP